jgi:hypothetical protein
MTESSVDDCDLHVMKQGDNVIIDVNGEKQSCIKLLRGGYEPSMS